MRTSTRSTTGRRRGPEPRSGRHAGDHHRHRDRVVPCRARACHAATDGVDAALGIDPHQAATARGRARRRAALSCSPTRGRSPWARPASTTIRRRYARRATPPVRGQLALADGLGLPVVCTREARADTAVDHSARTTAPSSCIASRSPGCWKRPSIGATTSPSPGTSPTRRRETCGMRLRRPRPTGSSPRRTARTSRRNRCEAGRTSRLTSFTPWRRSLPFATRRPTRGAHRRQRHRGVRLP